MSDASPPPPCCPPGSWDAPLNPSGPPPPRGKTVTLRSGDEGHSVEAYVTGPSGKSPDVSTTTKKKKGIVVFPDVWGVTDRLRSICDTLADSSDSGYLVAAPDCFRGETIASHRDDTVEWLSQYPYDMVVSKDLDACIKHLTSESVGVSDEVEFGSMGFCWGVWALAKASSEGAALKCGVGPHPSTGVEARVFGRDEGKMLGGARMPILVLPAGNDDERLKPGGEFTVALEGKGGRSVEFPEMTHGWTTRGDLSVKEVRRDTEKALVLAADFFREML